MNKVNLTLEIKVSKSGNEYVSLVADLGYCKRTLSVDRILLCELFDCPPSYLSSLPVGTCLNVGYLNSGLSTDKDK